MIRLFSIPGILLIFTISLFLRCSPADLAGGGTIETTNGCVGGVVISGNGTAASGVQVSLIPAGYDPLKDSLKLILDTTDNDGHYKFLNIDTGEYTILSVHCTARTRALTYDISVAGDTQNLSSITLRDPGTIRIKLDGNVDTADGYVYIPGTTIAKLITGNKDAIILDSVPAETVSSVSYSEVDRTNTSVIRYDVRVISGDTVSIVNLFWKYTQELSLNTAASGAGVSGNVYNFPVLVRLTSSNFDFSEAHSSGKDLLFTGSNNSILSHEIERWDASAERAEIWVKVDTVFGSNSTQSITMYWGNALQVSKLSGNGVFDTAEGFEGVWHMSDDADDTVHDATVNKYYGLSPDSSSPQVADGVIGNCRAFDGKKDFITMPGTADSKLNFPESGDYTVYAWVFLDTLDGLSHCIVSKGYEQYYLRSTYISTNILKTTPLWEFVEFSETTKWQTSNSTASVKQWVLLTGVRQGNSQLLYCNGILVDSTVDVWQNAVSRNTANDLTIGRFMKAVTVPMNEGYCSFRGSIDEVRIISKQQSPDWIRLCYQNQQSGDRLVSFR